MFICLMVVKILLSSYNTLLIRPKNLYNANGFSRIGVDGITICVYYTNLARSVCGQVHMEKLGLDS